MNKKGRTGIVILIVVIFICLGVASYFMFSGDGDTEISSESETDIPELPEEYIESDIIKRSVYFENIENIENYEGEELNFINIEIISQSWGSTMPYWIKIVEEDGTIISLPFLGSDVPPYMQTNRRWSIRGVVEKEERGYFLNVIDVEII